MSEGHKLKSREYNIDMLSHPTDKTKNASRSRQNNTYQSSILASKNQDYPPSPRQVTREKLHPKRPLIQSVTRTSF